MVFVAYSGIFCEGVCMCVRAIREHARQIWSFTFLELLAFNAQMGLINQSAVQAAENPIKTHLAEINVV